ncbi:hypothetical protein AACH10_07210 [Ideonella sp. DXS22W]|uniref:Ig-like domain-containing protein n=1 Tax=Pseudaquabacterium inlustre TaxID=2984192 RepID=A0ABU9CDR0_9BURK
MKFGFTPRQIALAALAALGSTAIGVAPTIATAAGKTAGKYVAGDFHNHTTCSDGSISMQKLVNKSTAVWGLDWFVQAGHGGNGARNCTLVEDADLATPAYPHDAAKGPTTTWTNSIGAAAIKGNGGGVGGTGNMWRWQSIQEYQYPVLEYLAANKNVPLFLGLESVVAGHEHTSMSVITGQMPSFIDSVSTSGSSYTALGNATALAQWSYCFDRGDTDTSRGNVTGSTTGNNWNCAVPGSDYSDTSKYNWNATGQKLIPTGSGVGSGLGTKGHLKTLEALKWMAANHANGSYYVPAHLERAGPFNPDGNNGFNIEHLRNFNNTAPNIAFGFESQPGHGASAERGEYRQLRNSFVGSSTNVDSVGGTTYGGTGIYASQVGGVWDALLGEGRNWWFFASSDWHNRGIFSADDRRSTQDFQPGEYQRNYTMVRNGSDKIRPQAIVDGLRTGNNWAASGQLIDRLAFVACASTPGIGARSNAQVEAIAVAAATGNTDIDVTGCATMGEKLKLRAGQEVVVAVVVRDPEGTNNAPYSFANPSLAQVGITQPLNKPVLDHIDVIRGLVTGYKAPGSADYSGEWPRNANWLRADGSTAGLSAVPAGAKNTTASIIKTFNGNAQSPSWTTVTGPDNSKFLKMSFRLSGVQASQYLRLRGTNLPAAVPYETDASGNPLSDIFTNATVAANLRIPCTVTGTNVPTNAVTWTKAMGAIDGCPNHLAVLNGQKMVSYDVAAWADLWFYSNPIYVEVAGATVVAGVK